MRCAVEQRQLVGLITRRSSVRIRPAQPPGSSTRGPFEGPGLLIVGRFWGVNKRKRVALAKHRAKKRKLKARARMSR